MKALRCNQPGHPHQGHPPVTILMLAVNPWPTRIQIIRSRICAHPQHAALLATVFRPEPKNPESGAAWTRISSGNGSMVVKTPYRNLRPQQAQRIADAMRQIAPAPDPAP